MMDHRTSQRPAHRTRDAAVTYAISVMTIAAIVSAAWTMTSVGI